MTNDEKNNYLNNAINDKQTYNFHGPAKLYKYRPFDEYTFDMLENGYIYLCPAEKLDDPTDCETKLDVQRFYEVDSNNLKRECIDQIFQFLKPHINEENYEIARNRLYRNINSNGIVKPNYLVELFMDLQDIIPNDVDISSLVNWIVNIPEKLDDEYIKNQIKPLITFAYNARKNTIGICSFAEKNDIDYMWINYANNHCGYCIEYDVTNYEYSNNIFPVIYDDNRETNIIIQLVGSYIGQMIRILSKGQIQADSSQFLRLFLTKNTNWAYQNEWRFIGIANDKIKAPKITRIYLGENIKEYDKAKIKRVSYDKQIEVVQLKEK